MQRDHVTLLRDNESELRHAGVARLYLFGSAARDEARDGSDVDAFFDLATPRGFTLFSLAALRERMQEILGSKVDLMTRAAIHPRRRRRIEAQAVRVF
ncbi:MAG: nucleotidyltransferase family protein [Pseudomonadota bacterium]|nr:nucleotidyltransferase family protein [Pseudomonadota bacterium]